MPYRLQEQGDFIDWEFMRVSYLNQQILEESSEEIAEQYFLPSNRQNQILAILKKEPTFTAKGLSKQLNISQRAVEKQLNVLKKYQYILHVGSTKSGHWQVLK